MSNKFDSIIIGGGVIGCSVAYYLSKLKQKVLIIEKDDIAAGSAGATDGFVAYHTKKPGFHLDLAVKSGQLYDTLSKELEEDIEYEHCGALQPIEDELQWKLLSENAQYQKKSGVDVRIIDIKEARALEPQLSPKLLGALYSPTGGKVNPFKLTMAYAHGAKRKGAVIQTETRVIKLLFDGTRVIGVQTNRGDFFADKVINAAGSWGGMVAKLAGIEMPIKPRRGQLIVTEPVAPFVNTTVLCALYTVIKFKPEAITDEKILRTGNGFVIEQTKSGALVIGGTREFCGFDKSNTIEAIETILKRALTFFPGLKNIHVIRTFSGLRPYTKDGLPCVGELKSTPGFVMCAGHEGDGIALAPITGMLLAEQLVYGKSSFSLDPLSPERFL